MARRGKGGQAAFDEMSGLDGQVRPAYRALKQWLEQVPPARLRQMQAEADLLFRRMGITFAVYGESAGNERLIPFDVLPRILAAEEWQIVERGAVQRVRALNAFLDDVYHQGEIFRKGLVPAELVERNKAWRPEMRGIDLPGRTYVHVAGIDIVRTEADSFTVLEDNLRTPSGVSYMLENRDVSMRLMPEVFARHRVAPVDHYPDVLLRNLRDIAPPAAGVDPTVVLLTPGIHNSAYFEHAFLAEQMGIELVEGQDLFAREAAIYMRTSEGPKRVDVIYRRIDDDFLDPLAFRPESVLGVPGLYAAYRAGNVSLANAIGTGVADDKAIYAYVPAMIEFYLGEKPVLKNVQTWQCAREDDRKLVLDRLAELVVKQVDGSGGYGMLVGPKASKAELARFRGLIRRHPERYIAQPTLALSTCPTHVAEGVAPRHLDLRPYVLSGKTVTLVPGGLTRVALRKGSLVVNSSQGGGTKDTWVLRGAP
ncbi:MAG: circularly permuted type 2 ATP-grasp protein [Alphaproteobacteria bacterium]|nr:circularly permuted type 2 ATP-grasp protein [Alphaproteobacteria bacterium]